MPAPTRLTPTTWTGIENAIRAWAKAGSGYDDAHVVWAHQNAGRPPGAFISLTMGAITPHGIDEIRRFDNSGGSADTLNDLELQVQGIREFSVNVQVFTPPSSKLGPAYGDSGARSIAAQMQAAFGFPSVVQQLKTASVSNFDLGVVQYVPALAGTVFEGRAVFEPRFYTTQTASDFSTWIEHVAAPAGTIKEPGET